MGDRPIFRPVPTQNTTIEGTALAYIRVLMGTRIQYPSSGPLLSATFIAILLHCCSQYVCTRSYI
jgi:hypothetical protein